MSFPALLLQPHGFEGGGAILVLEDVDHFAVANLDVQIEGDADLYAASSAARCQTYRGENLIAPIKDLLDVDPVLFPGVEPAVPDPHGTGNAVGGRVVCLERSPINIGVRDLAEAVCVVLERPQVAAHDLHVLLRHRLLLGRGGGRLAKSSTQPVVLAARIEASEVRPCRDEPDQAAPSTLTPAVNR
jgi:hypothetical protein